MRHIKLVYILRWSVLLLLLVALFSQASHARFKSFQKISDTQGGFNAGLEDGDDFGESVTALGDLDLDGTPDMAVTAEDDDDGGSNRGAVYVLFMNPDGTVSSHRKISQTVGGFTGQLDDEDELGNWITTLGDVDGDGITDIAVAAIGDDDGGNNRGAIWIIFLNRDGTAKGQQKISDTEGGFTGALDDDDCFGCSLEGLDDFNNDGIPDLAAGTQFDDDGGSNRGAVWLLMLNSDGTVKNDYKISDTAGGFTGGLGDGDSFGQSVATIGDFDGDGIMDLAVGAEEDDDGGVDSGAVWLLTMNSDGTVKNDYKISDTAGGFTGGLDDGVNFGQAVEGLGDIDGDGVTEIAVGAEYDTDSGERRGAAWILYLNADGTVKSHFKINDNTPGFEGQLDRNDEFGQDITNLGDIDGDGVLDMVVAADADDDGGDHRGAVYVFFLVAQVQQDSGSQGIVSIEAEHFNATNSFSDHEWVPNTLPGSSGNKAMEAAPNIRVNITGNYAPLDSPRLDFEVNFVKTGTHYVWVRGYGPNTGSDSIHIGLDNIGVTSASTFKVFSPTGSWVWSGDTYATGSAVPATINIPSTGLYTINAWMREDGFIFDKIVLTTDPAYVPTGLGPTESSSGGNQAPVWNPIGNKLVTESQLLTFNVTASDLDGPAPLILTATNLPGNATFTDDDGENGTFSWSPTVGDSSASPYSVTFTATEDGGNGLATAVVTSITVNPELGNQPPVLDPTGDKTIHEAQLLTFNVSATDTDGPTPLVLNATGLPDGAIFTDNGGGSGSFSWSPNSGDSNASPYSITFTATENNGDGLEASEVISISVTPEVIGVPMESEQVLGLSNIWTTVNLLNTYTSPVVITTPNYTDASPPLVVRVRNVGANSFDVRVVNVNNPAQTISGVDVYFFVVEEGIYNQAEHGITMEARRYVSTVTDYNGSWIGQSQSYTNNYTNPIVLGQVMTENDSNFSVFWCRGADRNEPPSSSILYTGKHVGEDSNITRVDETIGYMVIEAGAYTIDGLQINTGIGPVTIEGVDDVPPYSYSISDMSEVTAAVVSQVAMNGGNGGWAILYDANPLSNTSIKLAVDEDQLQDSERSHIGEQVAYLVVNELGNKSPVLDPISNKVATEGQLLTFDVTATDPDGPAPLILTATNLPGSATFNDNGGGYGAFSWTPAVDDSNASPYSVTFTATEDSGNGLATDVVIYIIVNPESGNQAPVLGPIGDKVVTEGQLLTFNVTATDPDGPAPLILTATNLPGSATFNDNGGGYGAFSWTPAVDDSNASPYSVTFTATEDSGNGLATDVVIYIIVNPGSGNQAPVLDPIGDKVVTEGQLLTFNVTASDPDGPVPLIIEACGLPENANFVDNGDGTGVFTWAPAIGDAAAVPLAVTFTVIDDNGAGASNSETIFFDVQSGGSIPGGFQQDSGSQGFLSIEAEHFNATNSFSDHEWVPNTLPGSSGNKAMEAAPNIRVNITGNYAPLNSPRLDFEVNFVKTGTHYVWVRGYGPNTGSDSIHIGLDNIGVTSASTFKVFSPTGSWVWSGDTYATGSAVPATINIPSTGLYTINAWMREDGFIFDKIVLTTDPAYVPTGLGPTESSSGGSILVLPYSETFDTGPLSDWVVVDEAGNPSSWVVQDGSYLQQNQVWSSSLENLDESYHIGSFSYLTPGLSLQNYRVSFDMTPMADTGDDVGCMIRYQNANNFYRLSFNSRYGYARLEKRVSGQFVSLVSDGIGYEIGQTYQIDIEVRNTKIYVHIDGNLVFAVEDSSLMSGTFAFYSAAAVKFDNLFIEGSGYTPMVGLSYPLSDTVLTSSAFPVSAVVANMPCNGHVEFLLDGNVVDSVFEAPYISQFTSVNEGYHEIEAILYDGDGIFATFDQNIWIGVDGDYYVATGDSLTLGAGDNFKLDNVHPDNFAYSFQGYPGPLGRFLTATNQYPTTVINEGVGGDKSIDLSELRIDSILERHSDLNSLTLLIGTNDAMSSLAPTRSIFANNVQSTVNKIKAFDNNIFVTVGITPPTFGAGVTGTIYSDPISHPDNDLIREYRDAVTQDVTDINIGPDFFNCFLEERNLFSLFSDNVHLNGLGYDFMARIWQEVLTGNMLFTDPCYPPRFILLNLEPSTIAPFIKQNLLEVGDRYYVDEDHIISSIPQGFSLEGGVWIMMPNSEASNSSNSYISFTTDRAVDIYIAYDFDESDPLASVPDWLASFSNTGATLEVSDPSAQFKVFQQWFPAGDILLGGNLAQGADGADVNYVVIAVEN